MQMNRSHTHALICNENIFANKPWIPIPAATSQPQRHTKETRYSTLYSNLRGGHFSRTHTTLTLNNTFFVKIVTTFRIHQFSIIQNWIDSYIVCCIVAVVRLRRQLPFSFYIHSFALPLSTAPQYYTLYDYMWMRSEDERMNILLHSLTVTTDDDDDTRSVIGHMCVLHIPN